MPRAASSLCRPSIRPALIALSVAVVGIGPAGHPAAAAVASPTSIAASGDPETDVIRGSQTVGPDRAGASAWWVLFTDRGDQGLDAPSIARIAARVPEEAWARRARTGSAVPEIRDLPLWEPYVREVAGHGRLRHRSRWLNGVSVELTEPARRIVEAFPFVAEVRPVAVGRMQGLGPAFGPDGTPLEQTLERPTADDLLRGVPRERIVPYGPSYGQLQEILVPAVHDLGYTGNRVRMMMIDTGFRKDHDAFAQTDVFGEWDFIFGDGNVQNEPEDHEDQHIHGTGCWAVAGGYDPGRIVGPAFGASFFLAKTEDIRSETQVEEDYYVAALEEADQRGVLVTSASLAYLCFDDGFCYNYPMKDGDTAVITRAVDIAAERGILCVNGIGNRGDADESMTTPADADSMVAVGAVDSLNQIAGFSSHGPTDDGRMKPEVVARGVDTWWANANGTDTYGPASGTSLSTPLVGGAAALLLEAHPEWGPMDVREALMQTADRAGLPDNYYGWGRINTLAALNYEPVLYPVPFSLVSPVDGETTGTVSPTFTWRASADPDHGALVTYALHLWDPAPGGPEWWIDAGPDTTVTLSFPLENGSTYSWEVAAEDPDDHRRLSREVWSFTTVSDPASTDEEPVWNRLFLSAGPNPFADRLRFRIEAPGPAGVQWAVFDPIGREVAGGTLPPGSVDGSWDGTSGGRPVASGVYYLEVRAGARLARMAVVRMPR